MRRKRSIVAQCGSPGGDDTAGYSISIRVPLCSAAAAAAPAPAPYMPIAARYAIHCTGSGPYLDSSRSQIALASSDNNRQTDRRTALGAAQRSPAPCYLFGDALQLYALAKDTCSFFGIRLRLRVCVCVCMSPVATSNKHLSNGACRPRVCVSLLAIGAPLPIPVSLA